MWLSGLCCCLNGWDNDGLHRSIPLPQSWVLFWPVKSVMYCLTAMPRARAKQLTVDKAFSSFFLCVCRTLASLIKRRWDGVCESVSWSEDVCQIFSMQCIRAECFCSPFWSPPQMFPASLLSAEEQRSNENHLVINGSSRRTREWLTQAMAQSLN